MLIVSRLLYGCVLFVLTQYIKTYQRFLNSDIGSKPTDSYKRRKGKFNEEKKKSIQIIKSKEKEEEEYSNNRIWNHKSDKKMKKAEVILKEKD